MSRALQWPPELLDFGGLNERASPHQSVLLKPNEALILDNLRPLGGLIEKIKGRTYHSIITGELVTRPTTLIRFSTEAGTRAFLATAWRQLFRYGNSVWTSVMQASRAQGQVPENYFLEPNYTGSWFIFNDFLYYTDGYNYPIKFGLTAHGTALSPDYNAQGTMGTWGLRAFTNATQNGLRVVQQNGVGNLINGAQYLYFVTLRDSIRDLEGNVSTYGLPFTPNGANRNVWVHFTINYWSAAGNYDFDNQFADQVRIYRSPGLNGGAGTQLLKWRVKTLRKGLISNTGTVSVNAGGTLTGVDTQFVTDGVQEYYAVYFRTNSVWKMIWTGGVGGETTLTLRDQDGQAYGTDGVGVLGSQPYYIFAGFIDNTADITTGTVDGAVANLYAADDTTLEANTNDHSPPPDCRYCLFIAERTQRALVSGNDAHPNRVYWSHADNPDYFFDPDADGGNWIDIEADDGDRITGLVRFQGRVYVFKRNSTCILNVDGAPGEWTVTAKVFRVGAIDQKVIVDCDGVLIWASPQGVFRYDGSGLENISHDETKSNLLKTWEDVQASEWANARAVYNRKRREFWLTVCLNDSRGLYDSALVGLGDGTDYSPDLWGGGDNPLPPQNNVILVYQLLTGKWFRIPDFAATAWSLWDKLGDDDELYAGLWGGIVVRDDNDEGYADAVGDAGVTAADATIRNLIKAKSHQTWSTDEWRGATCRRVTGGEAKTVLTNDVTTLNIGGRWNAAPLIDEQFSLSKRDGTITSETGTATGSRDAYIISTATGGGSNTLVDTGIGITPVLSDILILRPGLATEEWGIVFTLSGGDTITCIPNGVTGSVWTNNPAPGDAYYIFQSLKDTAKSWTYDTHAGKLAFLRTGAATAESAVIMHNSDRVLACETFNDVDPSTDWTSNPANGDAYEIFELTPTQQSIAVRYQSPMLHFGNQAALKRFFEFLIRVLGDTTINIAWTIDGNESQGGNFTIAPEGGGAIFDTDVFDPDEAVDAATDAVFGANTLTLFNLNFADHAEGYYMQFDLTATTNQQLQLYFWSVDFHRQLGGIWLR